MPLQLRTPNELLGYLNRCAVVTKYANLSSQVWPRTESRHRVHSYFKMTHIDPTHKKKVDFSRPKIIAAKIDCSIPLLSGGLHAWNRDHGHVLWCYNLDACTHLATPLILRGF